MIGPRQGGRGAAYRVDSGERRPRRRLIAALIAALAITVLVDVAGASAAQFAKQPLPIERGRLFDLGVTDSNNDGRLDVFTTNHKFLGSLLERQASGWKDMLGARGLSATPQFPGWEDLLHKPKITAPGLYLYLESRTGGDAEEDPLFHLVARDVDSITGLEQGADGRITLLSPAIKVKRSTGGILHVARDTSVSPARTVVSFKTEKNAHLVFAAKKVDLPPIEVEIFQAPARARTYVGANKVPATSRSFRLFLRDRHGFAWGDFNSDGKTDAAIVRGGLGGAIKSFSGILDDELMVANRTDLGFTDRVDGSGINKGRCRGRRTEAVDYNRDGRLDLFISCKRGSPKLYRGRGNATFQGVSRELRRIKVKGTAFRWVSVDKKPGEELLAATKKRLRVYGYDGKRFRKLQEITTRNTNRKVESLTATDFDRDGDEDVLIADPSRNTLLMNRGGRLEATNPIRRGLPGRSMAAAFTDYDNDGLIDLHLLPQGIYEQVRGRRFKATGKESSTSKADWAVLSWFDADNDGSRDYIRAINRNKAVKVSAGLFRNRIHKNRWLQIDLVGKGGNKQGIGAKVTTNIGGRRQTQWVGDSDSSRFSKGHFRLYFGAGKAKRARKITVDWPLGSQTVLRKVRTNQRLLIRR